MRPRLTATLSALLFILLGLIVLGTAIAFGTGKAHLGAGLRRSEEMPSQPEVRGIDGKTTAYTALGQIRAATRPESPDAAGGVVSVTPWFSYPAGDAALNEELFQKTRQLKSVVTAYFSRHTLRELRGLGEEAVKRELTQAINECLVLGAVTQVYFDDYVFFE
jgi:flagellar basal body-associated protein FliL